MNSSPNPTMRLSGKSRDHDNLVLEQLSSRASTAQSLKDNFKVLLRRLRHSPQKRHYLIKETDLLEKTVNVIKARKGVDHCALQVFIECIVDDTGAETLLEKGINEVVLGMIEKALMNDKRLNYWTKEKSKESKSLVYLMRAAQYKEHAIQLKKLNAISTLNKLFKLDFDLISIDSTITIVNIVGFSDDNRDFTLPVLEYFDGYDQAKFIDFVINGVVSALDLTLRQLNGTHYTFGRYNLKTLLNCVRFLAKDGSCKKFFLSDAFEVVRMLYTILQNFHEARKPHPVAGGGGDDIELAEMAIDTLAVLLVTELERDNELCERLISRGLATLLVEMYERPDVPLESDENGSRLLLRLSCWIVGHGGEYLPILKYPGSSLKVGKLFHGEEVVVSEELFYKTIVEDPDFRKIPAYLRPPKEIAYPHYRLSDGRGYVRKESNDHNFANAYTVSKETKSIIRIVLKTLLGYDKYDPADPVYNIVPLSGEQTLDSPGKFRPKTSNDEAKSFPRKSPNFASPDGRALTAPSSTSETFASIDTLSPLQQPPRMRLLKSSQKKKRSVSPASPLFVPLPSLDNRNGNEEFMHMLSFDGLTNAEMKDRTRKIENAVMKDGKYRKGKDEKMHIYMSYAKGCKNEKYVKTMTGVLRNAGCNVFCDEGVIDRRLPDRKAEAMEAAPVIIVCVSKKYHEIAVEEANYAKGLEKLGNTQVLYAMLDENYTTDSAPFRVSGWLGNMVTGTTWYPCWTQFQAESVGNEIISNINRTVDQRIVKKLRKPPKIHDKPII